jgi:hypothetical protein
MQAIYTFKNGSFTPFLYRSGTTFAIYTLKCWNLANLERQLGYSDRESNRRVGDMGNLG